MASVPDFPDLIREGDPLLGNSYRHYYGGSYYHLVFPDWPEGYRRDVQAAVYLEDKEKGEHRRVGNETLSEAVRKDYWKEIDWANAHPMTDGPSMERFERDLKAFAKNNPKPQYIPLGGMDVYKRFPDRIPRGDPQMDHSYSHWYEGTCYHLLFPDWPMGYRKDALPAVYTLDEEKGEYCRVPDTDFCWKVAEHHWQDIDEQDKRMMNPPPGPFRTTGTVNPAQLGFTGMMDGPGMLAPQFRSALEESMAKGSVTEENRPWTCPSCGRTGNTGRFCPECAQARPKAAEGWTCPSCGKAGNTGKFCRECGQPKPVKGEGWTCPSCGTEGNKGNFCAGCGTRRPD